MPRGHCADEVTAAPHVSAIHTTHSSGICHVVVEKRKRAETCFHSAFLPIAERKPRLRYAE